MSLAALATAVEGMADTLMTLDCGDVFSGMTCGEMDSIATVFVVAGRMDAAGHVVMMHAEGDYEEEDEHNDVYLALQEPGAGFSHDVADEPFRLAVEHAKLLS
jgi:hypothetical protein